MSCETYGFLLHAVLIKLKVTLIMLKVRLLQKLKKHKGDGVILEKKEKKDGVKREIRIGMFESSKYWFWCFISFVVFSYCFVLDSFSYYDAWHGVNFGRFIRNWII